MKTTSDLQPVVRQIFEEVIDEKLKDFESKVREIIQEEMRKESDRQYEIMRVFFRSIDRDLDEVKKRVGKLENVTFA